jgi:hypothetical protein
MGASLDQIDCTRSRTLLVLVGPASTVYSHRAPLARQRTYERPQPLSAS